MKLFQLEQGDMYFGDHELREMIGIGTDLTPPQDFLDDRIKQFFEDREKFKEYIDIYGKIHGLNKYGILLAHGDTNGKWVYFDDEKEPAVQSWINKVDGKYSGLLLCVCNPGSHTPKSKKSILLVPDSDLDFLGGALVGRNAIFSILVPKLGEIDSYIIDDELKQLKEKI